MGTPNQALFGPGVFSLPHDGVGDAEFFESGPVDHQRFMMAGQQLESLCSECLSIPDEGPQDLLKDRPLTAGENFSFFSGQFYLGLAGSLASQTGLRPMVPAPTIPPLMIV